jgi:enoyl-CoA hydratase/carnithine racemase
MPETLRTETEGGVRLIVFTRAELYNTITLTMRDELAAALDEAESDDAVKVIMLAAEGPAFCAGYGLDWSTETQARQDSSGGRAWDSVADLGGLSTFTNTFARLWYSPKPTISAVQGWCIGGGTDLVLWSDIIIAGEGAKFGYPPSRVWGIPTTPMWVYRLGVEQAKRYLLTGDEISAAEAARIGLILEAVPDGRLREHAFGLASRMAQVPSNQLAMIKMMCNQPFENMGLSSGRMLAQLFDGVARHTQEGLDFVARAKQSGFRQAVRERDDPFGDYGSRPR